MAQEMMLPVSRLSMPYWLTRWLPVSTVSALLAVRLAAEGALGGVLRAFVVFARVGARWDLVLGAAVHLAPEAAGHVMGPHGFSGNFIDAFRFDIVGVFQLVVSEIFGPNTAPGIGGTPDKRGAQRALGLVHLGAGDLVDEPLVVLQGLHRMGDLDVHGAAGGHGLEVFGAHDTSHAGTAAGIFYAGHDVGKAHQVFAGRADDQLLTSSSSSSSRIAHWVSVVVLPQRSAGVADLDLAVMDKQVDRLFGLALDDQMVESGPGHLGGEKAAHVGAAQQAGERRFGHDMGAGGGRGAGGGQNAAADNQARLSGPSGSQPFGRVVVIADRRPGHGRQEISCVPPAGWA